MASNRPYSMTADGTNPRNSSSGKLDRRVVHGYQSGMVLAGKYRLREPLGEGGMGAIWTAEHLALHVEVAVKIIHPELAGTAAGDRLLLEAHAAALLRHRSIVKVHDFGFSNFGDPFFVMERLRGESLFDLLRREGALPQLYAAQLMLPIIEAMVAAHAEGIIHRDLKPENIMIITDDAGCLIPKVLDFGVAKVAAPPIDSPSISLRDTLVGTPEYMSPEQARGENDVDERADVWGLSMILFEMLMGEVPFRGSNYHAVLLSILGDPTPPLRGVERELASIVARGLEKDRADRWASARGLGVALARWLTERDTFEDITTASIRARWGLNSSRPPSSRPVTEPLFIPPPARVPAFPSHRTADAVVRGSNAEVLPVERGSRAGKLVRRVRKHLSNPASRRGLLAAAGGMALLVFAASLGKPVALEAMDVTTAQAILPVLEVGKTLRQRMMRPNDALGPTKPAKRATVAREVLSRDASAIVAESRAGREAKNTVTDVVARRDPVRSAPVANPNPVPTTRPTRERVDFGF